MNDGKSIVRVVDDDASFLTAVARMLRASGFTVKTYASAVEFLAQPELDVPGCVLVDLQMPGLSGLDLQAALEKAGHLLPVIFLSGRGDIPTTVQAMRRGAEDFLTKRAPKEEVLEAVKRALLRDSSERAESSSSRTREPGIPVHSAASFCGRLSDNFIIGMVHGMY